jgi:hypothetical protein
LNAVRLIEGQDIGIEPLQFAGRRRCRGTRYTIVVDHKTRTVQVRCRVLLGGGLCDSRPKDELAPGETEKKLQKEGLHPVVTREGWTMEWWEKADGGSDGVENEAELG